MGTLRTARPASTDCPQAGESTKVLAWHTKSTQSSCRAIKEHTAVESWWSLSRLALFRNFDEHGNPFPRPNRYEPGAVNEY